MTRVEVTGIGIAIVLVLLAVAGVAMAAYVVYYYVFRGLFAHRRTVPAEVLRKVQRESASIWTSDDPEYGNRGADFCPPYEYFIVFGVPGGQLEFCVPEYVYADVSEGDTGFLVHKGTLFRRFVKDVRVSETAGTVEIRKV
jgi:hypothetical protein